MAPNNDASQAKQPEIKVYWLNDSRAERAVWLLEELGLTYSVEIFHRNSETNLAPPELERIHPLGKAPVVTVTPVSANGPAAPIVLAESAFIAEYLVEHFGAASHLAPPRYHPGITAGTPAAVGSETESWMRYRYFLHYVEGSLMSPLTLALVLGIFKSPKVPFFVRPVTGFVADKVLWGFVYPNVFRHLAFLESQLATAPDGGPYLCGAHLTAADIMLGFPLSRARGAFADLDMGGGRGKVRDSFPKLWAYVDRLMAEPGLKRSLARMEEAEAAKK
ncbi:glutathione S-transferase-like protein [Lasiosphaeria ovina]|uniref:Glutathione S-transferase-like protein n=1 Tax=Lasiosphaeria ovina TaxID=92902 RepID=A0AAE0MXF1_9PEZI|nr:glutathione S-transferase-like protein [Lasiosphaeria ovina]